MEKPPITRREASLAVLLTIVSVAVGKAKAQKTLESADSMVGNDPSALYGAVGPDPTAWGSDGTRGERSNSLDVIFTNNTSSEGTVREEDRRRIQPNGEYLLADQFRAPLLQIASIKKLLPDQNYLYQAFVYRNPRLRCFIKANAANEVIAAALADTMDVRRDGQLVAIHPRITVFYKTPSLPIDLQNDALTAMTGYYSQFSQDTTVSGYDIHVFARQLSDVLH